MRRTPYALPVVLLVAALHAPADYASGSSDSKCGIETRETARMAFHRTWFEEADGLFDQISEACPDDAQAYAYAAIIDNLLYRDSADNIAAAESLLQTSEPSHHSFERALIHFAKGELSDAESELLGYLETSPSDSFAEHVLGFTLIDQGRPADGAEVLTRLLERDPDYFPANNHLAYALMMTDRMDDAISTATAFVEADPLNPSAWDTRASILDAANRRDEAIANLTRSTLLDKRFAYGWSHMADLFGASGEWALAEHAYRHALQASELYGPAFLDGESLIDSAYSAFRAGETERSREIAHKALAVGSASEDTETVGNAFAAFCRLALREANASDLESCTSELAELAQDSAEPKWEVYSIHMRAEFARMNNDLDTADALYLESLNLSEAIGLVGMVAAENFNRSIVSVARGDLTNATRQVGEFFRVTADRDDGEPNPYGLIAFANLLVAREDYTAAAEVSFAAERIFDELGIVPDPADAAPLDAARATIEEQLTELELKEAKEQSAEATTQLLIDQYL